ncbi:Cysteine-rich secretory protein LCCL domain-containing 1 [Channa argus]|uniref:Cysteine-rich secretory protein LCCL domain-containing 1 n=1 Tax=Channa argus TaxID=215402 RepID=A0A6G1Q9C1_CHAAH|nr:Cysteine-rich secretory protein LCCL domain-containing 1 [Channa argus]
MKRSIPFLGWVSVASLFLYLTPSVMTMVLTNSTQLESILDKYRDRNEEWWARSRGKRAISEGDMHLILDLHNKLRGQVHPPASNMEYMLVWATSNRIGCAINVCYNMNVWGMIWAKAVYLVCNYSPPGNWWGHAPYKYGTPCSACPPSYAGGCRDNLCYKDGGVEQRPPPEIEETNYIEPEPVKDRDPQPRAQSPDPSQSDNLQRNQVVSTEQMCQQVNCETKLRDRCKGTTCNRPGKVVGTGYYDMQSSVCGAGLHSGVIDNDGGWLDVTRLARKQQFTKSYKNGIQSIGKNRSANSFKVESVPVKAVTCDTTVALFCPFKKPVRHCPRLYCPRNCLRDSQARVIGTKYYLDKSSICRAAIHAGVIQNESGGYLDVMPVDKRRQYSGIYQNGITSDSLLNTAGGKAFRVFAVI